MSVVHADLKFKSARETKKKKIDNLRNLWKSFNQRKEKRGCCFYTDEEWQCVLLMMAQVWRYLRDITGQLPDTS